MYYDYSRVTRCTGQPTLYRGLRSDSPDMCQYNVDSINIYFVYRSGMLFCAPELSIGTRNRKPKPKSL